ncbi:GNAT family N-acetyltransferase [Halospeciosus flavus]|uniref:GNAT family N-acetyltransferase n=1 Tax=Halospeciosus flavus TaxID=3032283 RepID=A0ABD5Z7Y0_9EURY|nr:GNAT family protein [Halospeciosus flavus]
MPGAIFLEGERVALHTIEEADLGFLQRTINSPAVRSHLTVRTPKNARQEQEWYEQVVSSNDSVNLLVCVDGERVGTVSLDPIDHPDGRGELHVALAEDFWGEGYGTEAAELLTTYAFDELRKHRVVARVFAGNERSKRVFEKLGFRHEATFEEAAFRDGDYVDVDLFAVLDREWRIREESSG